MVITKQGKKKRKRKNEEEEDEIYNLIYFQYRLVSRLVDTQISTIL